MKDSLTVLIGLNGAGKTNILSAISKLKEVETVSDNNPKITQPDESSTTNPQTIISMNATVDGVDVDIRAIFTLEFDEHREKIEYSQLFYKFPSQRNWKVIEKEYFDYGRAFYSKQGLNLKATAGLNRSTAFRGISTNFSLKYNIIKFLDEISYFSATRFSDPTQCPASLELKNGQPRNTSRSIHVSLLNDMHSASKDVSAFNRYKEIVGPRGLSLVDDIEFEEIEIADIETKVFINGQVQNRKNKRTLVIPTVTLDGIKLPFGQLSEGTFKSLALVFYLITSSKQILLIEEPEVGIHHGLLASLMEIMQAESSTKQIIVSTHSDYVLDTIKLTNLVIVTRDGQLGTKAQPIDKAMQKIDYNYLKSYLRESGTLGEYWRITGF